MRRTPRSVLVTGGAGYVGSHVVRQLLDEGDRVVVLDDLSRGHAAAVDGVPLVVGDYADRTLLERTLREASIEYVIHLAASSEVGASMSDPSTYYRNNVSGVPELLDAVVHHQLRGLVLSSTAAVYGDSYEGPLRESYAPAPTNTYGDTKLAFERMLHAYHRAHGLRWIALRYFNAAGAHPGGEIGEHHEPETHLIPRLLQAAGDAQPDVTIYGDDYPTPDGTCVRDYVHVVDLARAHSMALDAFDRQVLGPINLGAGSGSSVLEVVREVERVTGRSLNAAIAERRPGDPAELVASSDLAHEALGWRPERSDLGRIVADAWRWHCGHPHGFGTQLDAASTLRRRMTL